MDRAEITVVSDDWALVEFKPASPAQSASTWLAPTGTVTVGTPIDEIVDGPRWNYLQQPGPNIIDDWPIELSLDAQFSMFGWREPGTST